MPTVYPDRGVIAPSMMVSLRSELGEEGAIYYTTDGEMPTRESKHYTTPFFITEDGQACQSAAQVNTAARGNPWDCTVMLRAFTVAVRERTSCELSSCLCYEDSRVFNASFHVLSA